MKNSSSGARRGKLFYSLFFGIFALLIVAAAVTLILLHGWLTRYEAAQPTATRNEIMQTVFLAKDWETAVSKAAPTLSPFENTADYVRYMDEQYRSAEISSVETSAGLSGGKQYIVKADGTEIARFSLSEKKGENVSWALESITLFCMAEHTVVVRVPADTTVSLNGIAVEPDRYTTRQLRSATGEDWLELTVSGLLNEPTVTLQQNGTSSDAVQLRPGFYADSSIGDASFGDYTVTSAKMEFFVNDAIWKSETILVENGGITLPIPDAPAGKHFAGWAEKTEENGKITAEIKFKPMGKGRLILPVGYELLAMRLHAVFEDGEDTRTGAVSVSVRAVVGHTVFCGGKQVGDEAMIMRAETEAESYLPDSIHGLRLYEVRVTDPNGEPDISVRDENGVAMEVSYDPEKRLYTEKLPVMEISAEERNAIQSAVQIYGKYMINAASAADLKTVFDSGSKIYANIRNSDNWMQDYTGYRFTEPEVSEYYAYGNGIFSARIKLTLQVTRKNGSQKEYPIDSSLLLKKATDGSYKAFEMTNKTLQALKKQVRLDFYQGETLLESRFVDAAGKTFTTPLVDGNIPYGWAVRSIDDSGNTRYTVLFTPDENGNVYPADELSPLELYAVEK